MTTTSVIIPAFNRAAVVGRAIESALSQTVSDIEVIVVDDGSKDDTRAVAARWVKRDKRVSLAAHDVNQGAQAARNTGAAAARGEWLCFLDSDDEFLPDSLELRLGEAERGQFPVVHSAGWKLRSGGTEGCGLLAISGDVYDEVLRRPGPTYQSLLIKAEAFRAIGGLDPAIIAFQEWDTAIRLAKRYPFGYVSQPTFVYDCTGLDTISKNLLRSARGYDQVVRKHLPEMRRLGRKAIAFHYRAAAQEYLSAGDGSTARRRLAKSLLWWPGPRTLHALLTERPGYPW